MLKPVLILSACILCQFVQAQWITNGTNIYNSNSGNVGINTSNPRERLQIGDRFTFQDGGWKGINYNMAWSTSLNTNVRMVDGPSAAIYFTSEGSTILMNGPANTAGSTTDDIRWSMVINNSGQVGIGTSDPKNYMLAVNGPAIFTKAVVKPYANWPDYVFRKDYHLPSLPSVAKYIHEYKYNHLPDIPSADSVANNGIELGASQAALLRKIEELTLYAIVQNQELESQARQINAQKVQLEKQQHDIEELKEMVKNYRENKPLCQVRLQINFV